MVSRLAQAAAAGISRVPRWRLSAQYARDDRRDAGKRQPGGNLVVLLSDFGVQGVVDRFGQIAPKVLVTAEGFYNGKALDCLDKVRGIVEAIPSIHDVVVVPYTRTSVDFGGLPQARMWNDYVSAFAPEPIEFVRMPFGHPLYIMYSPGTTGVPKCIVHGAGGTLMKHLSEHLLHCDVKPSDRLFYYNLRLDDVELAGPGLAAEATLPLYDGSPFYPALKPCSILQTPNR